MKIEEIPISKIKITENIRQSRNAEQIVQLMQSIKLYGLLQPIGVKREKDGFLLMWGSQRLEAMRKLEYKTISAVIFLEEDDLLDEMNFTIINAIENFHRSNRNTLLELGRYISFWKDKGFSFSEISAKLVLPTATIRDAYDTYIRLPEKFRNKVVIMEKGNSEKKGKTSLAVATKITRMNNLSNSDKEKIMNYVISNDISSGYISYATALMSSGFSIDKAFQEVKNWSATSGTCLLRKEVKEKIKKEKISLSEVFTRLINEKYGKGSAIAISER